MLTFAVVYIIALCLGIAFMAGASIVNEQWDKSNIVKQHDTDCAAKGGCDACVAEHAANPPEKVWPIDPKVLERGHYGPR